MKRVHLRSILNTLIPSIKVCFGLTSILISVFLITDLVGWAPNDQKYELDSRKKISESFAVLFSELAAQNDVKLIRKILSVAVERDDRMKSAGFRYTDGRLLFQIRNHENGWGSYQSNKSTSTHVVVPVFANGRQLGSVEIHFTPLFSDGAVFSNPTYSWLAIASGLCFVLFLALMLRTLRQIDPSSVVPERVNAAFDSLAEGVVILDDNEHVVLANKAFSEIVKRPVESLFGIKLSELGWRPEDDAFGPEYFPWITAFSANVNRVNDRLVLDIQNDTRTMLVNSAPILDGNQIPQGMLLTFDDVTELEHQKLKLQNTVSNLEVSRKEIQRQNKELFYLATRDPLTGSYNRRFFYEQFDVLFSQAQEENKSLCCIMVDIDHFKKVNDNHGHDVGDEVIKMLAQVLESSTREEDVVGRYGGEEFCIVLPGLHIDEAISVAERIRLQIYRESHKVLPNDRRITASLGVATLADGSASQSELNKQADQALYAAKNAGRNQVVRWGKQFNDQPAEETQSENAQTTDRISLTDDPHHQLEVKNLKLQIRQLEKVADSFVEQLQKEKHYDKVTGLPNQSLFYDRVHQAIERSNREDKSAAILVIEFDSLSTNQSFLEKRISDDVFTQISKRLARIFRKTDAITVLNTTIDENCTVSRINQNDFGILIADIPDQNKLPRVIDRVFSGFSEPVQVGENKIRLPFRMGISMYPNDASSAEELLSHALIAKSNADNEPNKGAYRFFNVRMHQDAMRILSVEREIRASVEREEWLLHYQPKMNIVSKEITSAEALIRWNHPTKGLLGPGDFIEIAEESGLIVEIGEWVLRSACEQIARWNAQGIEIRVSVNLSAVQLRLHNIADLILDIVKKSGIKKGQLELELTETMLIDNYDQALRSLNQLHANGLKIVMDDFGTGFSSLTYLKKLPVDTIKIDKSFVSNICHNEDDRTIVSTVISMAHSLKLDVVAEGVEDQNQLQFLSNLGCDEIQGYLLSKPIEAEAFADWLQRQGH